MCKRRFFLFSLFVVAIVAVFSIGEAFAFSDEPCSKSNYEYCSEPASEVTSNGWTIKLDSITLDETTGQYKWLYIITDPSGSFTGSNFVGFLIPDCCRTDSPDDRVTLDETASDPDLSCFGVAEGESTIYFGRYNNQAFVCKGNPDSTGHWTIVANTSHKTRSTIIIKTGKDVIQFEMAVPGCPPAPMPDEPLPGSRSYSECSNFGNDTIEPFTIPGWPGPNEGLWPADADDRSIFVIRSDTSEGCVYELWFCDDQDCPSCTSATGCDSPNCYQVLAQALPSNVVSETYFTRLCPDENVRVVMNSPIYTVTVNSGGRTYVLCYDLAIKKYVPCP